MIIDGSIDAAGPDAAGWEPLIENETPRSWAVAKRAIDVTVASAGLIATAPLLIAASVGIMLNSPGSPIFAQERVGRYGRRFTMFKLRTMHPRAHERLAKLRSVNEVSGPVFKMKNDPRVFALGRYLRKLSIDELPNLVNVLLGDMSIVGPRPPLPSEVEGYTEHALRRLRVKPGITCIWQISGRSSIDFNTWMDLDHLYIDTWSPAVDIKIILSTIPAVLRAKGAY